MSVSLSTKPASKGQGGAPHGSKERSPRLENSRDMPSNCRRIGEVWSPSNECFDSQGADAGPQRGAGRIKQRVLTPLNHSIHVIKADTFCLARRISRSTFLSTVQACPYNRRLSCSMRLRNVLLPLAACFLS